MDYVLFGIQGSGKGTQGKIVAEKLPAAYFETGGELRHLSKEASPLGKKVKAIIEAGHLVDNNVVMEIVDNFIKKTRGNTSIIFDGLPRNKEQSDTFQALLKKMGRDYTGIYFELSKDDAENRLLRRRICSNCKTVYPATFTSETCTNCGGTLTTRADDNADSIKTRLNIFFKETVPVVEEWKKNGRMMTVDASGTIPQVTQELLSKLHIS